MGIHVTVLVYTIIRPTQSYRNVPQFPIYFVALSTGVTSSPVPGVITYFRPSYAAGRAFFFRGTHNVRDDLQLSHFVG